MLFAAAVLLTSSPCSPAAIAAAAVVSQQHQEAAEAVGLSNVVEGFQRPSVQEVTWRGPCTPHIVGLYGGSTLVAADGLMFWTRAGPALRLRDDHKLPVNSEPPHPDRKDRRFVGSASLIAGPWRVGAWERRDGTTDFARYRPGDVSSPLPLMTSARHIVGLFYLGLPDAVGGTLFFAQKLGPSRFRMIAMPWSEAGLRAPRP